MRIIGKLMKERVGGGFFFLLFIFFGFLHLLYTCNPFEI